MKIMATILNRALTTERKDAQLAQWASFAASGGILVLGLIAAPRMATTSGELLIGVLAVAILSVQLLVAGVVVPRAMERDA